MVQFRPSSYSFFLLFPFIFGGDHRTKFFYLFIYMPGLNFRGEYIKLETNDGTVSLPFVHLQILKSGAIVFVEPILFMSI
jgi:hypothetical protein